MLAAGTGVVQTPSGRKIFLSDFSGLEIPQNVDVW